MSAAEGGGRGCGTNYRMKWLTPGLIDDKEEDSGRERKREGKGREKVKKKKPLSCRDWKLKGLIR